MMHLPALVLTKQAERILSQLSKVGIAVRYLWRGTETLGNLYQLSNQLTLGQSEKISYLILVKCLRNLLIKNLLLEIIFSKMPA